MANRWLIGVALILIAAALLLVACPQPEPQTIERIVTQVVEVEKVIEVDVIVERTVIVTRIADAGIRVGLDASAEAAATEASAAAAAAPPVEPAPQPPQLSFAVVHDTFTELFRGDGARAAVVDTAGRALVHFSGDRALVVDAQQVRAFGPSGNQAGQAMPVSPGSAVALSEDRVVISHDSYAAIYDAAGQSLLNIRTHGLVKPGIIDDLIVLTAEGWIGAYRLDGKQVVNAATSGEPSVQSTAGRLALIDDASVRFFRADGSAAGPSIPLTDQGKASVIGKRVAVTHPGWTDVYALDGSVLARIATTGAATVTAVNGWICVRDDGGIRLFDADGSQMTQAMPSPADAEVVYHDDGLVVIHDGWVGIYNRSGESLANIATAGRCTAAFGENRLVIADDEVIRLLSPDGQPVALAIRLPDAEIDVVEGRLIATADGQMASFDLNGTPLAVIATSGQPDVMPLAGGFLVVDDAQVMLLSPLGDTIRSLAGLDAMTTVVSRD
jgi:hypothetical protein